MKKHLFKVINGMTNFLLSAFLGGVFILKKESKNNFLSHLLLKLYFTKVIIRGTLSFLIVLLFACTKETDDNCYKVTTVSSACQGIIVQFTDEKVTDQNGAIVPNIIELLNVPQEFYKVGTSFYIKFIYDEAAANKPVACPAVYEPYKIYHSTGAYKSSCENQ